VEPLVFQDGRCFSTGLAGYGYHGATEGEETPRLFIQVVIENDVRTEAMLDTGAPFYICAPDVAEGIKLDKAAALDKTSILIRGQPVKGSLYRLTVTLLAEEGCSLDVEVTTFVPEEAEEKSWGAFPSVLGFSNCLERVRFAVDPTTEVFYFGPTG